MMNRNRRATRKGNSRTIGGKWSLKYKNSIDCSHPKGFSQKQHCKYGRRKKTLKNKKKSFIVGG